MYWLECVFGVIAGIVALVVFYVQACTVNTKPGLFCHAVQYVAQQFATVSDTHHSLTQAGNRHKQYENEHQALGPPVIRLVHSTPKHAVVSSISLRVSIMHGRVLSFAFAVLPFDVIVSRATYTYVLDLLGV